MKPLLFDLPKSYADTTSSVLFDLDALMTESTREKAAFSVPQVLVVEDDEAFRQLITKQLEFMGCEVQITSDASDFLGQLSAGRKSFDLVVVDIFLPGLNGDQIISWIRKSELTELNTMPVLIITGGPQHLFAPLLDEPNIGVLCKPYEYSELKTAVTQMLLSGMRH